jgi:CobQ-like glutamine amidotransferase family enzyme
MYYDLVNLYGDYGNLKILEHHLNDIGVKVEIDKKTINEDMEFAEYDFIYMGAGTERNQLIMLEDLRRYKDALNTYINSGKYALFTGNSFEVLGKKIESKEALNILDFEVQKTKDRITSDVILTSKYFKNEVVGFINKMSNIVNNQNPLFEVTFGVGENENNDYEGVKYKNFYGTYVSGPILIRNPEILKALMLGICEVKDRNFKCKVKKYKNEEEGYLLELSELMKRKTE